LPKHLKTIAIRMEPAFQAVLIALEPQFRSRYGPTTRYVFYSAVLTEYLQDAPRRFIHHGNSSARHYFDIDRSLAERIAATVDVPIAAFGFNAFEKFASSLLMRESVYNRVKHAVPDASTFGLWFESRCAALGYDLSL
tara:strand:+ start:6571 stop:6984 length:414 start_codon:yes stop_codon:yes gene_type:complete